MESFNTDQSVQQAQTEQPTDQLTFNVGERQYDVESAATKIANADAHIAKIEAENAALREQANKALTEEAIDAKLKEALSLLPQSASNQEAQVNPNTIGFDEEKLSKAAEERVLAVLKQQEDQKLRAEAQALEEKTFKETAERLSSVYGKDVDKAIQEKAGVSFETALQMARHPEQAKILLKVMEADTSKPTLNPSGGFNTAGLKQPARESRFKNPGSITVKDIVEQLNSAQ